MNTGKFKIQYTPLFISKRNRHNLCATLLLVLFYLLVMVVSFGVRDIMNKAVLNPAPAPAHVTPTSPPSFLHGNPWGWILVLLPRQKRHNVWGWILVLLPRSPPVLIVQPSSLITRHRDPRR